QREGWAAGHPVRHDDRKSRSEPFGYWAAQESHLYNPGVCRKFGSRARGGLMKLHWPVLLGLVATTCAGAPAAAATITSVPGKHGSIIIDIHGRIATGDADVFNRILEKAADAGKSIAGVLLNSPGGKLDEGAKLAFVIRLARYPTVVAPGAICASACFLVFA